MVANGVLLNPYHQPLINTKEADLLGQPPLFIKYVSVSYLKRSGANVLR